MLFWLKTGWTPDMLKDKVVLDLGSEGGRFAPALYFSLFLCLNSFKIDFFSV